VDGIGVTGITDGAAITAGVDTTVVAATMVDAALVAAGTATQAAGDSGVERATAIAVDAEVTTVAATASMAVGAASLEADIFMAVEEAGAMVEAGARSAVAAVHLAAVDVPLAEAVTREAATLMAVGVDMVAVATVEAVMVGDVDK
jgi:hypothetical protein